MSKRHSKPESGSPNHRGGGASNGPWRVPLSIRDVPEGGLHVEIATNEQERHAIAELAGLLSLPRLEASFDLTRHGRSGLHLVGRVSSTVSQTCVVTLDPIENEIDEPVDIVFAPPAQGAGSEPADIEIVLEDAPEPLVDGTIDLGAIATEFLILGLDPYPRKAGIAFQGPNAEDDVAHPFAVLAALKKGSGGRRES